MTAVGLLAGLLLAGCGGAGPASPGPRPGGIALQPCHLWTAGLPVRAAAECGTLTVAEDPGNPEGRQIGLFVAVVRATGRGAAADPLFFLTGGPGQAASESYLPLAGAFERINRERDIVLVDQRGTGQSNPLDCPGADEPLEEASPAALREYVDRCLAGLEADPRFYTTALAIQDLEAARKALGYERINLYGVSYGTRVALAYMRAYPEQVRAAILDGVVPMDEALGLNAARDAQRALDLLFERCAAEATCREAFPDARGDLERLRERLRAEPARVRATHPVTGERVEFDFSHEMLANTVRLLSYAPETAALLPLLIRRGAEEGDLGPLAAQALLLGEDLSEALSQGMNLAVLCSEDAPFITPEAAEAANEGTYLGDAQSGALMALCAGWPRGEIPPGFKEPAASQAPTLLLSGEADPVTPPAYAERAAQSLPNSLHVTAPGQGHNVVGRGCLPEVAAAFIASGSTSGLPVACVSRLGPAPFFTSFAGPEP